MPYIPCFQMELADLWFLTLTIMKKAVGERLRFDTGTGLIKFFSGGCRSDCTLEWNSGGHFKDADLRTAKAFQWAMEEHK